MHNQQTIGKKGELIAAHFLQSKGYTIVARNFFARVGEIDLVAENETHRVFVEVKTKTDTTFGEPHEQVTGLKKEKMNRAAHVYNMSHPSGDRFMRFDVISIVLDMKTRIASVKHFENIGA